MNKAKAQAKAAEAVKKITSGATSLESDESDSDDDDTSTTGSTTANIKIKAAVDKHVAKTKAAIGANKVSKATLKAEK